LICRSLLDRSSEGCGNFAAERRRATVTGQDTARLYLAVVTARLVDGERQQSYLIAADDRIDAEHKLYDHPGVHASEVEHIIRLADDVAMVWGSDGQPWDGAPAAD
jgi:hypothetical protein